MRFGLYLLRLRQSCYHCRFSNTILFYVKVDGVIQSVLLLVAEVSVSTTAALQMAQHTTPEYKNWISFAHGLINVLCNGLRPFVTREMKSFYGKVSAEVAACSGGPCTCTFVPRRRPNQYHDMRTCTWANILQGHHRSEPNWKQSDSTKWTDPIQGPWEIAKLYIPNLGGHVIASAEDMDVAGILNLMDWCDQFQTIPRTLIERVRHYRNRKWGHLTKLELTNAEKANAFCAMEALLQDPRLAHDRDAQNALHEIQKLKIVTDVNNFQAQILMQYKEMIEKEIAALKEESTEELKVLKQRLRVVEEVLEQIRRARDICFLIGNKVKDGVVYLCDILFKCTIMMELFVLRLLTPWRLIILLWLSVTLLDPRSFKDGKF